MKQHPIPFNKPFFSGKELVYMAQAVEKHLKVSGNGVFTQKCHDFFKEYFGFNHCLLTSSCTDALEMTALLANIKEGDEVILPSYTFVSTANAFALRGARIVLADSLPTHPNIDPESIRKLITPKTKAVVVVHYGGIPCDMDEISRICQEHNLLLIEDSAHALDSYYKGKPCGTLGDLATFSFHETKNIISGEGGLLVVNNEKFKERSEILWEKGTNRSAFFRGEVDKYTWVDIGSSFLPSELIAAFLYAQLEHLEEIQEKRHQIRKLYQEKLKPLKEKGIIKFLQEPDYEFTQSSHLFAILCNSLEERTNLIEYLKSKGIYSAFHYVPLHTSDFYRKNFGEISLPNAEYFGDVLLRLPFYYELSAEKQEKVIQEIYNFYNIPYEN